MAGPRKCKESFFQERCYKTQLFWSHLQKIKTKGHKHHVTNERSKIMRMIVILFFLTMTVCHAEIIGEKSFSIPEIWFEYFQVPMPQGENRETISSIIHCDKITPFVRYQLNLTYSSQDGLSVTAEIIQDPTVTIQYLQPKSASEPAVPFLTAKNIKGSVLLSASSTQIWGGNGKIRYYVVLTAFERIACNLGRFSRRVPHCLSGVYDIDLQSGKISSVPSDPKNLRGALPIENK